MQASVKFLVLLSLGACTVVRGSPNVAIWELLTHQEKMGRLMYVFTHLVHSYCKGSNIPDCDKVLTLYGMSNLLNENDHGLNRMDPYQPNSKTIIWEKVMRGDFKLPSSRSIYSNSIDREAQADESNAYLNEVGDSSSSYQVNQRINKLGNDPHPYAVRVPAPSKIAAVHATRMTSSNLVTSDFDRVEDNLIENNDITAENVESKYVDTSFDNVKYSNTDTSDIAVGSSHPHAVKVLPESPMPENIPVEIKSTGDYEPLVMASQARETLAHPPTLTILMGK